MSIPYRVVQMTARKVYYDMMALAGILAYVVLYLLVSLAGGPQPDLPELGATLARAFGTLAIVMFHCLLAIGPLCRLHPGLLALLANRRHLGVATFAVASVHAALATWLYHTGGAMNPLASILAGNGQVFAPSEFPFEIFGFGALLILAALAFTSHDFWIALLGRKRWKRLHMLAYLAYLLLLLHVGFGSLQSTPNPVGFLLLSLGAAALVGLHWRVAVIERAKDMETREADVDGWLRICRPEEIPENRAVVVSTGEERVAVFRHWQGVSAISNVCAHQGGPLGDGMVEAGCVRCPWHGALYFPHNGSSPPPFSKSVATFNLRLRDGVLYLDPNPNAPGEAVDPVARPVRSRYAAHHGTAPADVASTEEAS